MALFSRRDKRRAEPDTTPSGAETAADAPTPDEPAHDASAPAAQPEEVPSVGISVSAFGGLGAQHPAASAPPEVPDDRRRARRGPELPPPQNDSVKGLRDNVLLRDSLAGLSENTESVALLRVARQVMQNHLFLRVQGDARALLGEGKDLPLAVLRTDDKQWALAYSSGVALQRAVQDDGNAQTSAMGQPVMAVLSHVLAGDFAGLIIDPSSTPHRIVLPRDLVQQMVERADPALTLKTLLAAPRTPETPGAVARALTEAPLFVAVNTSEPDASGEGRLGIAESRDADGNRILEIFSHPLEVVAMGRGDRPLPFTAQQLASALASHEHVQGVVLDAAGPWIQLTRDDLIPVISLANA
ncbi:MAG: SseB family protein [Microbacterium sp.]|uniref:SseB family protein n=1 Tax=Microbacterium sp. TaxID=51671 RepID=UPI003A870A6A